MKNYKIIRFFKEEGKKSKTIKTGLSLEEARAYCKRTNTYVKDI